MNDGSIYVNVTYTGLRRRPGGPPVAGLRESTKGRMEKVRHDAKRYICDIDTYFYQQWGEEKTEKEQLATFPAQGRDTIENRSR